MGVLKSLYDSARGKAIYLHRPEKWPMEHHDFAIFLSIEINKAMDSYGDSRQAPIDAGAEVYEHALSCSSDDDALSRLAKSFLASIIATGVVVDNIKTIKANPNIEKIYANKASDIFDKLVTHCGKVYGISGESRDKMLVKICLEYSKMEGFSRKWINANQRKLATTIHDAEGKISKRTLTDADRALEKRLGKPIDAASGAEIEYATISLMAETMQNLPAGKELALLSMGATTAIITRKKITYKRRSREDAEHYLKKNGETTFPTNAPEVCAYTLEEIQRADLSDFLKRHSIEVPAFIDSTTRAIVTDSIFNQPELNLQPGNITDEFNANAVRDIMLQSPVEAPPPIKEPRVNHNASPFRHVHTFGMNEEESKPVSIQQTATHVPARGHSEASGMEGVYAIFGILFFVVVLIVYYGSQAPRAYRSESHSASSRQQAIAPKSTVQANSATKGKSVFEVAREWTAKESAAIPEAKTIAVAPQQRDAKPIPSLPQESSVSPAPESTVAPTTPSPVAPQANASTSNGKGHYHSLNIAGAIIAIPIPGGYSRDEGFDQTAAIPGMGTIRGHFSYTMIYPKSMVQDSFSVTTMPEIESIDLEQFRAIKNEVRNSAKQTQSIYDKTGKDLQGPHFDISGTPEILAEDDRFIIAYHQAQTQIENQTVYTYTATTPLIVKDRLLYATNTALTTNPGANIAGAVKSNAIKWVKSILTANK